jgi:hypothetical protein
MFAFAMLCNLDTSPRTDSHSQRYFQSTNVGDVRDGHGTHVAGCAAGSPASNNAQTVAADYRGVAPNAKLAIDDISVDGVTLSLPADLNTGLFPHPYAAGARTHSISWGDSSSRYNSYAMEIDQFVHAHDDYLVHVAAGNSGPGARSVGSPATAKNVLTVGSSQNSRAALLDYHRVPLALAVSGGPAEWAGAAYALEPAAFGAAVFIGGSVWRGAIVVADPPEACAISLSNAASVTGCVVLIQRGACAFGTKVLRAQQAGAVAAIVINSAGGSLVQMAPGTDGASVNIPSGMISLADGDALRFILSLGAKVTGAFPVDATVPAQGGGLETADRLSDFSSRGPTSDRRFKPDILCPGGPVRSARAGAGRGECGVDAVLEMSGTSTAAPTCAGGSALVRQYLREGFHAGGVRNSSAAIEPTAALVKAIMIHSGRPVLVQRGESLTLPPSLPDYSQGFGRVELSSVLQFRGGGAGFELGVWDRQAVVHGGSLKYCLSVRVSAERLRVTVVWTDPPASPAASKSLINNLDLVVIGPGGEFFYGNALSQWDEAHSPHPAIDNVNNVEQVPP